MSDGAGEFALSHTGNWYAKKDGGRLEINSNWEGTATGFGTVFGTLSVSLPLSEIGGTNGACTWASQAFLDDGTTVGGLGEGTWEQQEGHRWRISLLIEVSNGDRLRSEGEIDLASRKFTGKFSQV